MTTQENFIGIYENCYSKEYCESVIKYYKSMSELGYSINRQQLENINATIKKDDMVFAHSENTLEIGNTKNIIREFNNIFWNSPYKFYSEKFSNLKNLAPHNNYSFKVQKTEVGGGYHIWHCESENKASCSRILAWILYLNDVEEGGETEFLYQHLRIKPKAGTLIMFPSAFTHTHRGNPPLSNEKYIVTGWIEF